MPFTIGIRTTEYIDLSNATADDSVKVTLADDCHVVLVLDPANRRHLLIDKRRTHPSVMEELYQNFAERIDGQAYSTKRTFKKLSRNNPHWRDQLEYTVWINSKIDTWDNSPRIGEHLDVMITYPHLGGWGARLNAPIKDVTFH